MISLAERNKLYMFFDTSSFLTFNKWLIIHSLSQSVTKLKRELSLNKACDSLIWESGQLFMSFFELQFLILYVHVTVSRLHLWLVRWEAWWYRFFNIFQDETPPSFSFFLNIFFKNFKQKSIYCAQFPLRSLWWWQHVHLPYWTRGSGVRCSSTCVSATTL